MTTSPTAAACLWATFYWRITYWCQCLKNSYTFLGFLHTTPTDGTAGGKDTPTTPTTWFPLRAALPAAGTFTQHHPAPPEPHTAFTRPTYKTTLTSATVCSLLVLCYFPLCIRTVGIHARTHVPLGHSSFPLAGSFLRHGQAWAGIDNCLATHSILHGHILTWMMLPSSVDSGTLPVPLLTLWHSMWSSVNATDRAGRSVLHHHWVCAQRSLSTARLTTHTFPHPHPPGGTATCRVPLTRATNLTHLFSKTSPYLTYHSCLPDCPILLLVGLCGTYGTDHVPATTYGNLTSGAGATTLRRWQQNR